MSVSTLCAPLTWLLLLGSPADPQPKEDDSGDPATSSDQGEPAETESPDPYAEQAPLDVETIMADASKAYLQARARLEAHPELAAEAIHDRLATVPAPGPAVRKRLLDVLAQVARPQDLPLLAAELQRAVKGARSRSEAVDVFGFWRHHLLDQGEAAAPHLQELVGDREIPEQVRGLLLADLVAVTSAKTIGNLVVLVGRGKKSLADALRRALAERAKDDPVAREALVAATDAALDTALADPPDPKELERLPALLRFRTHIGEDTPELANRLRDVAQDAEAAFGARAASVRGLGILDSRDADVALRGLASENLTGERRKTQRGEVLGWLALQGLPAQDAAELAKSLALIGDPAPRLAAFGYSAAVLPDDERWLPTALENPWPHVRQAALERVDGPCETDIVALLAKRGGASDEGGDTDRAAARSAVAALGRCGGKTAMARLERILKNTRIDMELRAEAARRLARHGGADGADAVAGVLSRRPDPAFARRLASALRKAPAATPAVDAALCGALESPGDVARAAADSLRKLHKPGDTPCE